MKERQRNVLMIGPENSIHLWDKVSLGENYSLEAYSMSEVYKRLEDGAEFIDKADVVVCTFYELHQAQILKMIFQKPLLTFCLLSNDEDRKKYKKDLEGLLSGGMGSVADHHYVINIDNARPGNLNFALDEFKRNIDDYFSETGS